MFKIKKLYIIMLIIYIFFIQIHKAESIIPMKAPNLFEYNDRKEIWDIDKYLILSQSLWIVYADREGVPLYKTIDSKNIVRKTHFLEKFYVYEKNKRFIKINKEKKAENDDTMLWARIEKFIIIPQSIQNSNSISTKAVIINDLFHNINNRKTGPDNNKFYSIRPLKTPENNNKEYYVDEELKILEIGYIYSHYINKSTNKEYILIGRSHFFYDFVKPESLEYVNKVIIGWIEANNVLNWNTREAFEPYEKRNKPIYFFKNKNYIESYYSVDKNRLNLPFPTCKNIPDCKNKPNNWKNEVVLSVKIDDEEKLLKYTWRKDEFRYPILQKENDLSKSFHIGIPTASYDFQRIIHLLDKQLQHVEYKDIVFLFDATTSMKPHIDVACEIATSVMDKLSKQEGNEGKLRFGAAVYRDYSEGDGVFDLTVNLTDNRMEITKSLNKIVCYSNEQDETKIKTYYPEAMFQGLDRCIQLMDWNDNTSKLLVIIGDAGDHCEGMEKSSENKIAKLLSDKDISYAAILITNENTINKLKLKPPPTLLSPTPLVNYKNAMKKFTQQNINIISNIIEFQKQKLEKLEKNGGVTSKKASEIKESYNEILSESKICTDKIFCNFKGRWMISNVKSDQQYRSMLNQQVNNLFDQVYSKQQIIEAIRRKLDSQLNKTEKNKYSFKPQLMTNTVINMVEKIGKDMFDRRHQIGTRDNVDKILGEKVRTKQNYNPSEEEIFKLGISIFRDFQSNKANFYKDAYVMFKDPESKEDLFRKVILLEKTELEKIKFPLFMFSQKYKGVINRLNIREVWETLLEAILGEGRCADKYSKNKSFKDIYEQQFGISLRSKHPLLNIPYENINSGLFQYKQEDYNKLSRILIEQYEHIDKILSDLNNFTIIAYRYYIWLKVSDLL